MFETILNLDGGQNLQKKADDILTRQIEGGKVSHAYLFTGQDSELKRLCALEFIKTLNCTGSPEPHIRPCGKCHSCINISKGNYYDIHFIDFKKQAEIDNKPEDKLTGQAKQKQALGLDLISGYMLSKISLKSVEAKWKAFIIDPADKLTPEASNALLKTLEEPPDNTIIILIAKHKETIIPTILSRCQTLFFGPIPPKYIAEYILHNYNNASQNEMAEGTEKTAKTRSKKAAPPARKLSAEEAYEIAEMSSGSIETALAVLNILLGEGVYIKKLWQCFTDGELKDMAVCDILNLAKSVTKDKNLNPLNVIDGLSLMAKQGIKKDPRRTLSILALLDKYKGLLLRNANIQTVFDILLLDLAGQERGAAWQE
jgi:DNA polymerase-3 subunit delta'